MSADTPSPTEPKKKGKAGTMRRCKVAGCQNTRRKFKDMLFFRFPKNKDLCELWIDACDDPALIDAGPHSVSHNSSMYICQDHFLYKYFCSDSLYKMRLREDAVPTEKLDLPKPVRKRKKYGSSVKERNTRTVTCKLDPDPPKRDEQSEDEYKKCIKTHRYISQCKLDVAKRKTAGLIRIIKGDVEVTVPAEEATIFSADDPAATTLHVSDDDDNRSVGECAALLDDDPVDPEEAVLEAAAKAAGVSPVKKAKFAHVYSVEDLDKGGVSGGQCLALLDDDPEEPQVVIVDKSGQAPISKRKSGFGTVKQVTDSNDTMDGYELDRRQAAIKRVVSSVQSLIRTLKGGQLLPSERETVCMDINVFTESKNFEIDIQCSTDGKHSAKMLMSEQ